MCPCAAVSAFVLRAAIIPAQSSFCLLQMYGINMCSPNISALFHTNCRHSPLFLWQTRCASAFACRFGGDVPETSRTTRVFSAQHIKPICPKNFPKPQLQNYLMLFNIKTPTLRTIYRRKTSQNCIFIHPSCTFVGRILNFAATQRGYVHTACA